MGSSVRWNNRPPNETQAIPIARSHAEPGAKKERPDPGPAYRFMTKCLGYSSAMFFVLAYDIILGRVLYLLFRFFFHL